MQQRLSPGKSLTMVWLARWIRENVDDSRVVTITDRTELDRQITRFFTDASEEIERAASGADRLDKFNSHDVPLISSLVRAYGDLANEMDQTGYSSGEAAHIKQRVTFLFRSEGRHQAGQRRLYRPEEL